MSFKGLLNAQCTIQTLTTTINSIGAWTSSFSAGVQNDCRIDPMRAGGEVQIADRWADKELFTLFVDETVSLIATNRVVSSGSIFNVLQADRYDNATKRHHVEAIIEVVR